MDPYGTMYAHSAPHAHVNNEAHHLAQRLAQIEYRLQQLLETVSRQHHYYQQLHQAYTNQSFGQPWPPFTQHERETTNSDQPEPGVPSEKHKLPEQYRREYIPPGMSGIVRM